MVTLMMTAVEFIYFIPYTNIRFHCPNQHLIIIIALHYIYSSDAMQLD